MIMEMEAMIMLVKGDNLSIYSIEIYNFDKPPSAVFK
jgi:hypothetical protein